MDGGSTARTTPRTIKDYQWALSYHLLPFFKGHLLPEITVAEVDRYKQAKVREGKLAAPQINKSLKRLLRFSTLRSITATCRATRRRRKVGGDGQGACAPPDLGGA